MCQLLVARTQSISQFWMLFFFFFFSSRRRHTRCREVSWARRCVQETASTAHKDNPKRQMKMRDFAKVLKDNFETVIRLELYPMSQINIHIIVLQNDGAYKSAAINAATLALVDAGINMRDLLVSATAGVVAGECCVDLLAAEEKKDSCCITIVYSPAKSMLTHLSVISPKMSAGTLNLCLERVISACDSLSNELKAYIKEYMSLRYLS
eukprot:TRINITY_DN13479_c0_g1_i1.p1 TRINITY_DN13479_c0_g1~~TRINITY_DN13479_c0_g1_i1.p1  ORF type:complete len:209 (+),score=45.65 TRINITY_DN13479_c0_g1_i1:2-628(+)